jgi:hypothetical protein
MLVMNWINTQKTNQHKDRTAAAEAATKDLKFLVTTFNLKNFEKMFPNSVSRICIRYDAPENRMSSGELEKRVATLEDEIIRIKQDLYGK